MDGKKKFEGKHSELTGVILRAFFQVHKEMGFGFAEKVNESALEVLLKELGLIPERQKEILVYYHGRRVGEYKADMIVNGVSCWKLNRLRNWSVLMMLSCSII